MYKSKTRKIVIAFIIFAISFLFIKSDYARYLKINKSEVADWKVAITSDAKDISDTQEIKFKVQDNPNVVKGKIAPGTKAIAEVEINLEGTKYSTDVTVNVDNTKLPKNFKLTSKLDGEEYKIGGTKTFKLNNKEEFTKENGTKILLLELEWEPNENDTYLGITGDTIKLPITIEVKQHI